MLRNIRVEDWKRTLNKCKDKSVAIITHKAADPDAFSAAVFFKKLLEEKYGSRTVCLCLPEGVNQFTKTIMEKIGIEVEYYEDLSGMPMSGFTIVIIVDACNIEQLGAFGRLLYDADERILVDHHAPNEEFINLMTLKVVDEEAGSTAELCYKIAKSVGYKPNLQVLELIATGIIYDTRHLVYATIQSLKVMVELLESGVNYSKIIDLMRRPMDLSERLARLKAAQRLQVYSLDKWIVALTKIGAYESSVARSIIDLGADVVFVASENKELRISARSRESFYRETGIHLGSDVMAKVGGMINGSGGGHPTAAAASGKGSADLALLICYSVLKEELMEKLKKA